MDMQTIYLLIPLASLAGAIGAGFFGKLLGRTFAHSVTIAGVATSFILSCVVFNDVMAGNQFNGPV